jgi:hypothetical protein
LFTRWVGWLAHCGDRKQITDQACNHGRQQVFTDWELIIKGWLRNTDARGEVVHREGGKATFGDELLGCSEDLVA